MKWCIRRKDELENLMARVAVLEDRQKKFDRILKHAGKIEPSFEIRTVSETPIVSLPNINDRHSDRLLYIYYQNREYVIPISEFWGLNVTYDLMNSRIRIVDRLAYLDLICYISCLKHPRVYHFTIDYAKRQYLCRDEEWKAGDGDSVVKL